MIAQILFLQLASLYYLDSLREKDAEVCLSKRTYTHMATIFFSLAFSAKSRFEYIFSISREQAGKEGFSFFELGS